MTVHVIATDADAPDVFINIVFWDEPLVIADCFEHEAHGRWETPPRRRGSNEATETRVLERPGTFEITVQGSSNQDDLGFCVMSPYSNRQSATRTIAVSGLHPRRQLAPEPSPTAT